MAPRTETDGSASDQDVRSRSTPGFVAEDLPGPDWLRSRRAAALARSGHLPLPTGEAEEWRYSRIAELDVSRFAAAPAVSPGAVPESVRSTLSGLGPTSGVVVAVDGRVVDVRFDADRCAGDGAGAGGGSDGGSGSALGVRFGSALDDANRAEGLLGRAAEHPSDLFVAWNDALTAEPIVLDVPAGVVLEHPFVVVNHAACGSVATFPRLVVRLGVGATASVIEIHSSDDVGALVVPVTELVVGEGAGLRHAVLQDMGPSVWQIASLAATVDAEATLDVGAAALGGDYARLRMDCHLTGRGATGNLSSVYLGDRDQMLDLRTFQVHEAPDTTSNLLFKGGVAGTSHSVYTGLIRIAPGARGSNAFQTNRNLKLSDGAWAESVPNLEIQNNDVHCSHASTVGPVDSDQRFYLESRGVPTSVAERLVVGGFFDEVLDDFAVPAVVDVVRDRLDATLDLALGRAATS